MSADSADLDRLMTLAEAVSLFRYDDKSGTVTWMTKPNGRVSVGSVAGRVDSTGYRQVTFRGRSYQVHRIVWLLKTGVWPEHFLDHIDGDRLNNRFDNLRPATAGENARNARLRSDNSSGAKGVAYHRAIKRWVAYISVDRNVRYLGTFDTRDAAAAAYAKAAADLHGAFAKADRA